LLQTTFARLIHISHLINKGLFEVLFTDEEGAKFARKITAVEWSGLNLTFSRYIPNFDASV
jgi:hypothetical protein